MMRASLILCSTLLAALPAGAAEINWERGGGDGAAMIHIVGKIIVGDEQKFRRLVLELIGGGLSIDNVLIYSPGGSVSSALQIGRQIRTLKIQTMGPLRYEGSAICVGRTYDHVGNILPERERLAPHCICTSACFLIWAGGYGRRGDWIGVHRPSFNPTEYGKLSSWEAEQLYGGMVEEVKTYLKEMDVPDNIIRKMMAANSQDIHLLTGDDGKSLANDPALE